MRRDQEWLLGGGLVLAIGLIWAASALTDGGWYFNWSCAGCAKIRARTTGQEGPFGSESSCNSARSSMQRGTRGVTTMTCYQPYGRPSEPSPPSQSRPSRGQGGFTDTPYSEPSYPQPTIDYEQQRREEEERRQAEERRRQSEEAERQRQAEQERQRQAELERQRQEQFIRDRDQAVGSLRGTGTPFFGIRGNPEGELQIRDVPPDRQTRNIPTAWKQLHCAGTIGQGTVSAARRGDIEEVRYLGEETIKALNGDPLGVQCPANVPDPPQFYGQRQIRQHPPELAQLYKLLIKSTEDQVARLSRAQRVIPELTEKKKEAEKKVVEKKQELEQVRQKPADPKKPEEVKEKKSAMAEALAALRAAEAALAEADKAEKQANREAQQANQLLNRNKEMFEKSQANPDRAAQLLSQLRSSERQARR